MTSAQGMGLRPISFLDDMDFLNHEASKGRLDKSFDGGVTVSAIPDASGKITWQAKNAAGESLPVFHMELKKQPDNTAVGMIEVHTTRGCFVCWDDSVALVSRCVRIVCGPGEGYEYEQ